jgi:hypothetical protein
MNVTWEPVDAEVTVDAATFTVASVVHATLFSRLVGALWQTTLLCDGAASAGRANSIQIGQEYAQQFGSEPAVGSMVEFVQSAHELSKAMKIVFSARPGAADPTGEQFRALYFVVQEATLATGSLVRSDFDAALRAIAQNRRAVDVLFDAVSRLIAADNGLVAATGATPFNGGALTLLVLKACGAQIARNFGESTKQLNAMHGLIKEFEGPLRTRVIKQRQ